MTDSVEPTTQDILDIIDKITVEIRNNNKNKKETS